MRQLKEHTEHIRISGMFKIIPEFQERRPSYGKSDHVISERRGKERCEQRILSASAHLSTK
jgi:hypothetical protein